jgi:hypothetical protein
VDLAGPYLYLLRFLSCCPILHGDADVGSLALHVHFSRRFSAYHILLELVILSVAPFLSLLFFIHVVAILVRLLFGFLLVHTTILLRRVFYSVCCFLFLPFLHFSGISLYAQILHKQLIVDMAS